VKHLYGSEPEITWFDTPVIVDNQPGGTITKAAWRARGHWCARDRDLVCDAG
jgi:hypothetical protein